MPEAENTEFRRSVASFRRVDFWVARQPFYPLPFQSMKDDQTAATKADIQLLMDSIGNLYDANERLKEELKGHFDLVIENLRHDFLGGRHDKVELLDDKTQDLDKRVSRLEAYIGV